MLRMTVLRILPVQSEVSYQVCTASLSLMQFSSQPSPLILFPSSQMLRSEVGAAPHLLSSGYQTPVPPQPVKNKNMQRRMRHEGRPMSFDPV